MAALPVTWYGTVLADIESGALNLETVGLEAILLGSGYTPSSAHTTTAHLSDELVDASYARDAITSPTVSIVRQVDMATIIFGADDSSWAALDPAARWVVLATTAGRLICWGDPGQVLNANGGLATVHWQIQVEAWLPATASDALGLFADTSSGAWTTATTWLGRVPKWRRQWARSAAQVVNDATWTPTLDGFRSIVDTATFPGNLAASSVSHSLPLPLLRSGQVLGDNVAGANDSYWRGLADIVFEFGLDVPFGDGRPKGIGCAGWEANSSNVNYIWKYASSATDLTLPDRFAADYDAGISVFKARMLEIGGDPDGFHWAYGVLIRPGASNYGYEDHIIRGCPDQVDSIEVDCYDSHFLYTSGMDQAARIAKFNAADGVWYRKQNDRQGLNVCRQLARDRGIPMGFGEWAVHHKISGSSNEGGEDNPDYITEMVGYMTALAAEDLLGPACYFESNANTDEEHKLNGATFDDAEAEFLSLLA